MMLRRKKSTAPETSPETSGESTEIRPKQKDQSAKSAVLRELGNLSKRVRQLESTNQTSARQLLLMQQLLGHVVQEFSAGMAAFSATAQRENPREFERLGSLVSDVQLFLSADDTRGASSLDSINLEASLEWIRATVPYGRELELDLHPRLAQPVFCDARRVQLGVCLLLSAALAQLVDAAASPPRLQVRLEGADDSKLTVRFTLEARVNERYGRLLDAIESEPADALDGSLVFSWLRLQQARRLASEVEAELVVARTDGGHRLDVAFVCQQSKAPSAAPTRVQPQMLTQHPEAPALDERRLQSLYEEAGSWQFVAELANIFVEDMVTRLEALAQAQIDKDLKTIKHSAHSIAGAALTFGAATLGRLAEELEDMALEGTSSSRLRFQHALLCKEFRRVRTAIHETFPAVEA